MIKRLCLVLACSALAAAVIAGQTQNGESLAAQTPTTPPPSAHELVSPVLGAPDSSPIAELVVETNDSTLQTEAGLDPKVALEPASPPAITRIKGPGRSGQLPSSEISGRDLLFLTTALENGHLQLYLGELARAKAGTEQVKAIGEVLASRQAEENQELARLAAMKGVPLAGADAASTKTLSAKFGKLSGPKLDKALMEEIIHLNERAVSAYEAAAQTRDREIKAFVDQGLPLAKEKLMLANKMTGNKPRTDQRPGFRAQIDAPSSQ